MKRLLTLSLACILTACHRDQTSPRGSSDNSERAVQARRTDTSNMPATTPSAEQRAVTDARSLESADLPKAQGGPAAGKRDPKLKPIALFYGPLPTGLTHSDDGRLFVNFPRWGIPANYTVAEVTKVGLVPFPDAETNRYRPEQAGAADPATHLVSVQSVVCDSAHRLWLLDTGSIDMQPIVDPRGPKLWAYDLRTGQRVKAITFENSVKKNSYLNDVRFDLARGQQGTAYITDSGAGAIVVVDLATGQSWRKLDGHPSTQADPSLTLVVEGKPMMRKPNPNAKSEKPMINSDGIALAPDGKTLYYTPLTSHSIYAVPTDFLADRNATDADAPVKKIVDKPSGNDGLICDAKGRLYSSDYEDNAIRRLNPADASAQPEILVQDERILWPDTFSIHRGHLYFTANQLHRQPAYHGGQNLIEQPYVIFEYPIDADVNPKH